jgi:prepilin-type N-terminal cleavage/methylation domain-containing protein
METTKKAIFASLRITLRHGQRTKDNGQRTGFTLVELLVVITIIGILAGLITVAAVGALKKARETEVRTEINQIDSALMEYKNKTTAFPPNCQSDDPMTTLPDPVNAPLNEAQVLNDLKRHMKQVASRSQEPEDLLKALVGITPSNTSNFRLLPGGMTAGEAIVFWLGGFSSDPKFPISGEGGPSYQIDNLPSGVDANEADPVETRDWVFPFEVTRLAPRQDDKYFDATSPRYIEYTITINGEQQRRRINFWQYTPRKSKQPYLYFDTSRHQPTVEFDPPAATSAAGNDIALHVHAFKKKADSAAMAAATMLPIQFVDPQKFQVLHCGLDDAWDEDSFERMSVHGVNDLGLPPKDLSSYLVFPTGPFSGDVADTIVNFTTETRIEDAQP